MRRPRPAIVVLIGSLMLLVGAPVAWAGFVAVGDSADSVESVGERPGSAIDQSVDAAPEPASAAPNVAGPDVERIGIPVEPRAVIAPNAPVSVAIDELGVRAPVDPVGIYEDGSVEIPEDVSRVGWFRFGSDPAQGEGSTVIVGHRDGFDQGAGAFYSIAGLDVGDVVEGDVVDPVGQLEVGPVGQLEVDDRIIGIGIARVALVVLLLIRCKGIRTTGIAATGSQQQQCRDNSSKNRTNTHFRPPDLALEGPS